MTSRRESKRRIVDEMEEALFSRFLPELSPPADDVTKVGDVSILPGQKPLLRTEPGTLFCSEVENLQIIPKKRSKVPALASIAQITAEGALGTTLKKKMHMTREQLRAGKHDPRGLVDLEGSSTNALEHIKRRH